MKRKRLELVLRKILLKDKIYYAMFLFAIIFALIVIAIPRESKYTGKETSFIGKVVDYNISGDKLTILLVAKEKIKGIYYFKDEKEKNYYIKELKYGHSIKIDGILSVPSKNTVFNTFNYRYYLYNQGIFYTCSIENIIIKENKISVLYKIKNIIYKHILTYENTKEYLLTFILGDKSLMEDDILQKYRMNGVTHLFAISGMHVGLFSLLIIKLLKIFKVSENKRYIIAILFIWLYAFLTGFSSSVLRASLFFTLLSLNKIFYTEVKSINVLLLTGAILIIINPFIIKYIAFQYSFIITFGLLYCEHFIKKHKLIGTSLIAVLFSIPITINNFYQFNFLSIFINVLFVPLVSTIVYPLCLMCIVFRFLEPILYVFIFILESISSWCSNLDFLKFIMPKMPVNLVIIYYGVLLIFTRKNFKRMFFIILIIILINQFIPYLQIHTKVYFLDVGQGDSELIILPHQKKIVLIDTGGVTKYKGERWRDKKEYNVSDNIITFMHSLGINKIDYLITTHGDADHMGETLNFINNFKIDKIIFNCGEYNELEKNLIATLEKKNIKYESCVKELNVDKYKLQFLNTKVYDNENDNSNVIYFNYNNYKFLFMGDAGTERENDILEKYHSRNIDFLKIGHHGSNTSSSKKFINSLNPKYSLISVGKNNRYGHPKESVLNILDNSKIYRTDLDGSIEIELNKNGYKINTCSP